LETYVPESHSTYSPFAGFVRKRRQLLQSRRAEAKKKERIVAGLSALFEKYKIRKAFLFGSVLRGSSCVSSDIDLYVEEVTGKDYWALWRDLEETANQPIDLYCQLDDPVFVRKIKQRGKLIYESGY